MQYLLRSVLIVFLSGGIIGGVLPQDISYASAILEYHPAPGQFINVPDIGTFEAATRLTGQIGNPLSLGGYGGYIIFGFEKPVKNNPANPFGIDFIIPGNAMENSSEQGIVRVMKDINNNGLPDDTWYEIMGSDHFIQGFRKNYRIRYDNTGEYEDIPWSDNNFSSGTIRRNQFNTQPYYPSRENFPSVNHDSLVFTGSLLPGRLTETNGQINSGKSYFGYADNSPFRGLNTPLIPDNPYTPEIEGCGGDGIDISWAVNEEGMYVDLDEIDFVMIYTGVNQDAGWLGEISTEVRGIIVVPPLEGISGPSRMIMPLNLPASLPVGSNLVPEAIVFHNGRPVNDEDIVWGSSNPSLAEFNNDTLAAYNAGIITFTARLESDPSVYAETEIILYKPAKLLLHDKTIAIRSGETRKVKFNILDNLGMPVSGSNIHFLSDKPEIINVIHRSGSDEIMVEGIEEGSVFIDICPAGYEDLTERLAVHVFSPLPEISCHFALRHNNEAIIPRHPVKVTNNDFSGFIDRKPDNYSFPSELISLASVINEALTLGGFNRTGNAYKFRIDEKSEGELYLWQIVRDWEFVYGWGGSTEGGAYKSCWVVTVNGEVYMNSFDKIPVANGDMVSLNYVADIYAGFSEVIISEIENNDPAGMIKKFRAVYQSYSFEDNAGFSSSYIPLSNQKILITSSDGNDNDVVFTESDGSFFFNSENPGVYRLMAEDYPGEEIIVVASVTDTRSAFNPDKIVIFPNPVEDELKILIPFPGNKDFEITDVAGNKLLTGILKGGNTATIPVQRLLPGIYIIRIQSGDYSYNYRFIKK